jgi:hypothetical protein
MITRQLSALRSPFVVALRCKSGGSRFWGTLTWSASEPGRVQLTHHDADGPLGHTCRDTIEAAAAEALRDYEVVSVEPEGHEAAGAIASAVAAAAARKAQVEAWLRGD